MVLFLVALLLILLWGVRVVSFNNSYLGKEQSTSIKGIFIFLVFLSHANSYIGFGSEGFGDIFYNSFFNSIGQLMVVMFLFYSGYGVLKSYIVKEGYEKTFFRNRILKTLVNFDICLIPFALLPLFIGPKYSVYEYILSLVGWESIGNSNWYICVVLILYVLSLIGMVFACFENRISKLLKSNLGLVVSLLVFTFLFLLFFSIDSMIAFMIGALCFALVIVILSSRVTVGNKVLLWLGNHLFEIYILQRIPMIILSEIGLQNRILFVLISFVATICLAYYVKKLLGKIDKMIFVK